MQKLRVGILGCGSIACVMAKTIAKMKTAELYACASRDLSKAKKFADQFGAKMAFGSYQDLAACPDVDLVYIAVPHSHHYETVKICIEGKKNVLCEKAFTVNADQARELFDLAKKAGVLLTEAMWVRYIPLCKTLQDLLKEGAIGQPYMCTANLHYIIDNRSRLVEPSLAGGALLDLGVYALTFASIVFGNDVESIKASAVMTEKGVDRQDVIALTYKDGKMADLNCGMSALSDRQGIIYGRNGYIIVENINNFEALNIYGLDRKLKKRIKAPKQISGYEYEVEACRLALEQGKTECPEMPHDQTICIMEQMDEIRRQIGVKL